MQQFAQLRPSPIYMAHLVLCAAACPVLATKTFHYPRR